VTNQPEHTEQAGEQAGEQVEHAAPYRDPRFDTVYAWVVCAPLALALVAFLVSGAARPPVVPLLVFVLVLAVSTNRVVVFPSEYAATADIAVLVAAVVAFRHDAPFTGPLVLGLLVGPLDAAHWPRRSIARMAINSGDRALAALAAAAAFSWLTEGTGTTTALVLATTVAAVAATTGDAVVSLGLMTGHGRALGAAWREILDVDALELPLALAGGAAGFLATGGTWWVAVALLLGLGFVPELVQARARIPAAVVRNVLLGVEAVIAALVVALFVPVPGAATVCVLIAVAVVVGAELVVDARASVPPVLGVVVVGAALAVGSDSGVFAAVVVGAGATATAWWCSGQGGRVRAMVAVAVAALAGVGAAWLGAVSLGGVLVFEGVAVVAARRYRRGPEAASIAWTAPLAGVVVAGGVLLADVTTDAAAVPIVALSVVVAAVGWCGATPWRSRVVSRRLGAVRGGGRQTTLYAGCALAVGLGCAALVVRGDVALACAYGAVVLSEGATAMALVATRQWRFAPRARARDAALLVGAALALAVPYPLGVANREPWSIVPLAGALVTVVVVGRGSLGRSDEAATTSRSAARHDDSRR
jgi:hypothetical protein